VADHDIARFPPILQLVLLGLLAGYVILSLLARTRRFRWLWDDPGESRSIDHFIEYTALPVLVLAVAAAAVAHNWEQGAPLDGGWSLRELTFGPVTAGLGFMFIGAASVLRRRLDTSDASTPGSWIPLVAILLGIALLAVGATSLGRTVNRASPASPAPPPPSPAPDSPGSPPPPASTHGTPRPRSGAG
jgi:hypothetical protein